MKRNSLSVVLATFNEEKNIKSCLDSVKDIADEIVIFDESSSDKTREIAITLGAKVTKVKHEPIFHITKNKAIDKASCEWILQLDADERATPELIGEIEDKLNSEEGTNGYWIPRKNYFLGKFLLWGGQYPDYTLRLYKNGMGRLPAKDVHEQAVVEGKVGYLKNDLLHFADKSFKRYLERNNNYIDLITDDMKRSHLGKNPIQILNYFIVKPVYWFLLTQIRHKGILDGWQGVVFSFFSALRFPRAYWRYLTR